MISPYEAFWLFVIPAAVFSWYHIVRNLKRFIPGTPPMPPPPHPLVIFSIAARSLTPMLKPAVDAIRQSCAEVGFTNYQVKLVVDKVEATIEGAEAIVVPADFKIMSRYKARALHYALRHLPNSPDAWTLHLDEDAMVTPQCVVSILRYIHDGGKPVANGPSVFPFDGNIFTFYAEAQRQWTFYWLMDQVDTSIVHWLNGSNLLIRSDIEHKVGWDFENCFISEDSRFGYEATKMKLGKLFGWHGGLTVETPSATVNGVLKQRTRWFFGSVLNLRYVPKSRLPRRIYSISAWTDGLILTVFFFVLVTGLLEVRWFSRIFLIHGVTITAIFWLARYQIGVYQNLRFSRLSRGWKLLLHVGAVPLAPVTDLICNLPVLLALIKPPRAFEITAKKAGR